MRGLQLQLSLFNSVQRNPAKLIHFRKPARTILAVNFITKLTMDHSKCPSSLLPHIEIYYFYKCYMMYLTASLSLSRAITELRASNVKRWNNYLWAQQCLPLQYLIYNKQFEITITSITSQSVGLPCIINRVTYCKAAIK
jgi:hypothetical protein